MFSISKQFRIPCKGFYYKIQFKKYRIKFSTNSLAMNIHANLNVKDGIGVVRMISPGKVNVLNTDLLKEMEQIITEIENNSVIKGSVLISNKPDCFIAGADINMLTACRTADEVERLSKEGQRMLARIENSRKPIVAAIMGSCLGGGVEVALGCHYRIAVNYTTVMGFPEVLLGLLPGGGGTQRLPKLIGVPNALDLMLTGKNVRMEKAKSIGLVDQIIDPVGPGTTDQNERMLEYLEEIAIRAAKEMASGNLEPNREKKDIVNKIKSVVFNISYVKDYVFKQAKTRVMNQTHGLYPAPLKILDVVRKGLDHGSEIGYREEAKEFGKLAMTDESKGLISLFYGQTECKKNKFGKPEKRVNNIGIVGAGLMGAGIAHVSLEKGYEAILKDVTVSNLAKGQNQIQEGIELSVKKKKMSKLEGERCLSNLTPTIEYAKFDSADLVIEAVFEMLDLKRQILREMESRTPEHCIFATNTSALSVSKIAEASKRPDKVIGMHYFSPVDKMLLLEIITTESTSKDTIRKAVDVGLKQGKLPIVVKDSPGFFTTRVIFSLITELFRLFLEGVQPKKVDELTLQFGFPIGISVMADEVGFDVGYHIYLYFLEVFGDRMRTADPELGHQVMKAGFLGRKSGKGIYLYESKERVVNEALFEIIKKFSQEPKVPLTDENVLFRLVARFVNEAVLSLQEGVIANPMEADVASVFGLGFPPFRGGPFHFVDSYGAAKLMNKMREFEPHYGSTFTPCQLLIDHAKSNKKFFPL